MTSPLNCLQWMTSQEGQNPCTTAQEVGQLCNEAYTVFSNNFQESTYVPSTATANGCTCSWSIYNLLSACSYCAGQYQYISTWVHDCGSYVSNTSYLPSGLSISQGIPFWAATNPSTWDNGVFNITQAADIASQDLPDVTGEPLPTSSTTASSGVSVGEIVGLLIGGISIVIVGTLFVLWAVYRRRRKAMRTVPFADSSFNVSQSVMIPPIRHQVPIHPDSVEHASAPPTRISTYPVTDSADIISPFLAASPTRSSTRQTDQVRVPPIRSKVAEAASERMMAAPGRRTRLNPPPYSDSVEPGSSIPVRGPSGKERRRESVSKATINSAYSGTSTSMSVSMTRGGRVGTAQSTESTVHGGDAASVEGGDSVEMTHGTGDVGESDPHPPELQ